MGKNDSHLPFGNNNKAAFAEFVQHARLAKNPAGEAARQFLMNFIIMLFPSVCLSFSLSLSVCVCVCVYQPGMVVNRVACGRN